MTNAITFFIGTKSFLNFMYPALKQTASFLASHSCTYKQN